MGRGEERESIRVRYREWERVEARCVKIRYDIVRMRGWNGERVRWGKGGKVRGLDGERVRGVRESFKACRRVRGLEW